MSNLDILLEELAEGSDWPIMGTDADVKTAKKIYTKMRAYLKKWLVGRGMKAVFNGRLYGGMGKFNGISWSPDPRTSHTLAELRVTGDEAVLRLKKNGNEVGRKKFKTSDIEGIARAFIDFLGKRIVGQKA